MGPDDHARPSSHARERAEAIVDGLFADRSSRAAYGRWRGSLSEDEPTALADVEQDATVFGDQLDLLSYLELDFPALAVDRPSADDVRHRGAQPVEPDEGVVPVSLGLLDRGRSWSDSLDEVLSGSTDPRPFRDRLQRRFEETGWSDGRFHLIPREVAEGQFRRRLTTFLSVRIDAEPEGRPTWPSLLMRLPRRRGARPTAVPGCTFVVTTNSPGLRVFWSGAYFLTSNYFSAPTSPACSTLQSGTYLFGVDGGAYRTVTWDTAAQVSLPGTPSVHLNF